MTTSARTLARAGLLGGLSLVLAAVGASSAGAASEEVEFSCEFVVGDFEGEGTEGEGTGVASFDTGIPDGLVVDVGTRVSLDPFTGSITLPEEFVTLLRDAGLTTIQGGGETFLLIDPADEEVFASFQFAPVAMPAEGTVTLAVEGEADSFRVRDPGVHTVLGGAFGLYVDTGGGEEEDPGAGMFCQTADGEDLVIDAFEATQGPEPTTTITATATTTVAAAPVRPVVVQTDFSGDEGATALPLLGAGALLALAAGALGLGRRARRSTVRRH